MRISIYYESKSLSKYYQFEKIILTYHDLILSILKNRTQSTLQFNCFNLSKSRTNNIPF